MAISRPHAPPTVLGLRRVTFVRISRDPAGGAEAVGIGHRHPASVRISQERARALAAHGVPLVRRPTTASGGSSARANVGVTAR